MKIAGILKVGTMLVLGLLLVAGCSHRGRHAQVSDVDESSSYANGLGKRTGFGAQDVEGVTYTTKAPHDQTYYYDFNNSEVRSKYLPSIQSQAKYLASHPGASVLLAGHTDERGSREYNIALGERRANSVAEIMSVAGVGRKQLRLVSYGQERPAALGHDEAAWSSNRRVEMTYEATH